MEAEDRNILSVTELTRRIKHYLSDTFPDIWVQGEISNSTVASSGHAYFTLKDESCVIRAVLFRGYRKDIRFEIENGLKVIVHGNLDVFEKRGEYQIIVDLLEPEGMGALQLAFEQLKDKLQKDGLFDESHKKSIPPFPDVVGVVTSLTGAAIRDILNVLGRRYSGIRIILYPTLVQGDEAADEIVSAIMTANKRKEADVLIVGRGGGSVEDLWPFNEEKVARAIFKSNIPIISAVGHEIDFTISDFVADLRAPTPSAAAELVVKNKEEVMRLASDLISRILRSMDRMIDQRKQSLSIYTFESLTKRINTIVSEKSMILDDVTKSLSVSIENINTKTKGRFEKLVGKLNTLSPLGTLSRGYAIVLKFPENRPVFSVEDVQKGDSIKTRFKDGTLLSTVNEKEKSVP
ncbi:MAG: exodeoxyribonuclease VII large subunit [Spirochaetota bacterium]|nr:MAG: exodeoxyribonuclease VII large subunit [Spirochaetota bacterium]